MVLRLVVHDMLIDDTAGTRHSREQEGNLMRVLVPVLVLGSLAVLVMFLFEDSESTPQEKEPPVSAVSESASHSKEAAIPGASQEEAEPGPEVPQVGSPAESDDEQDSTDPESGEAARTGKAAVAALVVEKLDRADDETKENVSFQFFRQFFLSRSRPGARDSVERVEGTFVYFLNPGFVPEPEQLLVGWAGFLDAGPGITLTEGERAELLPILLECSQEARKIDARLKAAYGDDFTQLSSEEQNLHAGDRRGEFETLYFELIDGTRDAVGDDRFASVADFFKPFGMIVE